MDAQAMISMEGLKRPGCAEHPEAMGSTLRCLRVLELMADDPFELSVSDVAKRLSVPKASAHRLLATLTEAGVIEQDAVSRRYRLAGKSLWIGAGVLRSSPLYRASFLVMQELAKKIDGTIHLGIWNESEVLYLYSVGQPTIMQMFSDVGDRRPLHATAIGKAMLAHRPAEVVERVLAMGCEPLTARTITTLEGMKPELERIRKLGYSRNDEELVMGVRAIAAPIRDQRGEVNAAISIAASVNVLAGRQLEHYVLLLLKAAARISAQLGFRFAARPGNGTNGQGRVG